MKARVCLILVIASFAAGMAGGLVRGERIAPVHPTRILCMGDSMTLGFDRQLPSPSLIGSGYRKFLLSNINLHEVELVGPVYDPTTNTHFAGYGGWTASQLNDKAAGWTETYQPDIVLLMAGTNDLYRTQNNVPLSVSHLVTLIHTIEKAKPNTWLIVSGIPPVRISSMNPSVVDTKQFNDQLEQAIAVVKCTYRTVSFSTAGELSGNLIGVDGIHPNTKGYERLGSRWASSVNDLWNGVI